MNKKVIDVEDYQVKKAYEKYMQENDMGYHRFTVVINHIENEIKPLLGKDNDIYDYAQRSIKLLNEYKLDAITAVFNGVKLLIRRDMTPEEIVNQYRNK